MREFFRLFNGSVRRQLITGVALVHAVMMSLFVWDLTVRQQDMLLTQQVAQARALAQSVATSSSGWLLARDVTGLQEIINAQLRYPELLFAMVVDRQGKILAHSDATRLGQFLKDLPAELKLVVLSENPSLADVMTPAMVAGEHVGWIRVGIGQKRSQAQLAVILRDGILYALAAILIGVLLAAYMGTRLTRRLAAIQRVADSIKRGELSQRARVDGHDEAARLAHEFNDMLDALEHASADLSATLQAIPDLLFELDQGGRYLNIWAREQDLLIAQKDLLLGHTVEEKLPAEAAEVVMRALRQAAAEGFSHGQTILLPIEGEERWFELSTSYKSDSGEQSRFIMLSRDITERKRAEDALRRSEMFSRSIVENSPECVKIIDRDGTLRYMNPTGLKLIEADGLEVMLGKSVYALVTEEYRDAVIAMTQKIFDGRVASLQFKIKGLKGTPKWLDTRAVPLRDKDGKVEALLGLTRDISEQQYLRLEHRQDQKKLWESEASLNRAQRIAHVGSWEYNRVRGEVSWSDELYRIFGLDSASTIPGFSSLLQVVHPDDRSRVKSALDNSIKSLTPYDMVYRLRLADDSIKYVQEHCETVYGDNGELLHTSGTIQDITEQRVKDEQLYRSQKMDAVGKLTGGIAHDFNNMLGVILGYAELLKMKLQEHPQLEGYVNEIQHAGERAKKLTTSLLAFSRKKQVAVERVDINQLLRDTRHMLEKSLTARIRLTMEFGEENCSVELGRELLEDAILNMSINAMHAMPEGGNLTIATSKAHLEPVDSEGLGIPSGDYILLSVTDTGVGMDREVREKIFDPFFTTKGEQGTGLGMSQVYGFVKQSRGAIYLNSEPGHGSRFVLYFPCAPEQNETEQQAEENPSVVLPSGSETILVVDDEPALCALSREILSTHGYRVFTAESGQAALKLMETEKVDLMLSDVIMPEMDGYQLAEEVMRSYPGVKVQMISGFDEGRQTTSNNSELAQQRLNKPVSSSQLLERIRELLDGS